MADYVFIDYEEMKKYNKELMANLYLKPSSEPIAIEDKPPMGRKQTYIEPYQSSTWAKLPGGYYTGIDEPANKLPSGLYIPQIINGGTRCLMQTTTEFLLHDLIKFDDTAEEIVAEIKKFLNAKEKFDKANIKYRRGLLLYGPPGGGKSCIIKELISLILGLDGLAIDASSVDPAITADMLQTLRKIEPDRLAIVFLEDIDSLISRSDKSQVLNLLDGVSSPNGMIFVATTNYPQDLEENIQNRPSRFDRLYHIQYPSDESRKRLIEGFSKKFDCSVDVDQWVRDTKNMTVAHINELFVSTQLLDHSYEEAIETLKNMTKPTKLKNGSSGSAGFLSARD